jgi:hypothetical protein
MEKLGMLKVCGDPDAHPVDKISGIVKKYLTSHLQIGVKVPNVQGTVCEVLHDGDIGVVTSKRSLEALHGLFIVAGHLVDQAEDVPAKPAFQVFFAAPFGQLEPFHFFPRTENHYAL